MNAATRCTLVAGLLITLITPVFCEEAAGSLRLATVVQHAVSMLKPVMDSNRVTVSVAGDAALTGDPQKIEDQFVNLLSNALVHAPAGSTLTVRYESAEKRLVLWVENPDISYSVKKECVDALGNIFLIETQSGKGTLYAIRM